jgi:hypothetical protein
VELREFKTKIKLGETGYVVKHDGDYNFYIKEMRVGQVEIVMKHPEIVRYSTDKVYEERYMCFETGVGSGTVYIYGLHIFSTKEAATNIGVVKQKQMHYEYIAARDAELARRLEYEKDQEIRQLAALKAKYENQPIEGELLAITPDDNNTR